MSVVIVGVIRRKPVLIHASIVCEGMLASVNSVNSVKKCLGAEVSSYRSVLGPKCPVTIHKSERSHNKMYTIA